MTSRNSLLGKEYWVRKFGSEIMNKNFNVWNEYVFSYKYEYQNVYEIESGYTLEQLKELLLHDYYVDTLAIAKILGNVTKII